ncbi:SMI1/KNR4 family protein [Nonomuraea sediminis]|uniref:SMI1/KNR4 family protein n=1 Tax=Nonomuraea sediminis TaxID=2835864 RepID=UPI001BDCF9BD|nr:SMI1/KNR4 family protein [Nonomuraea sediminis]
MLKLVRAALTAAVLAAVAVRLRRRARPREAAPPPPGTAPAARRRGGGMLAPWLAILAVVGAVVAVLAIKPGPIGAAERPAAPASPIGWVSPSPGPTPSSTPAPTLYAVLEDSCHPRPAAIVVRPLDPAVRGEVTREWRRIERRHRGGAVLGRPGRAHTIAVAEAQMGIRFPDDLRASLLRHNGFTLNGVRFLTIREIRDAWRTICHDPARAGLIPITGGTSLLPRDGAYLAAVREAS